MKKVEQILCMNGGDGDTSYAKNSLIQKEVVIKAKPILEECVREMLSNELIPSCLRIADFGCSSGPNALLAISTIIDSVDFWCRRMERKEPLFHVFLNDLPRNDYNTIFMSLESFHEKLEKEKGSDFGPCFVVGVPGNFYGRLFPDAFLHFAYSSYALHWLSKVPEGLVVESGEALNRGNIIIAKTSPRRVFELYKQQFEKDFTEFIKSRSQEMVSGGHMFLTMIGSFYKGCYDNVKNQTYTVMELLGLTLNDMVQKGLVEEKKLDSFNLPYYTPAIEEVRHLLESEGSFEIRRLETIDTEWDVNMAEANRYVHYPTRGTYVSMTIRVVTQPILASHFGQDIMDLLFSNYSSKLDEFLRVEKGLYPNIIVSVRKK